MLFSLYDPAMKLVECHIITKKHPFWSSIDHKAFLSTNLFNLANYHYRQYFFQHHQKFNFHQLYHQLSETDDYKALLTLVSKQIISRLGSVWISYFHTIRAWNEHPEKFLGQLTIPKYKDNLKGRNLLPHLHESISKKAFKKGICLLSMSNIKIPTLLKEIIEVRVVPKSKGIKVIITEESYTSPASALDGDTFPKYGDKKPEFKGEIMAGGLYTTGNMRLLNAVINGSFNMMKKVIPDVFDQGIKGLPFNPVVLDPLQMTRLADFEQVLVKVLN
ncbi:hypothetical protein [Anabaena azotica]|uniref:hypothetical protein n=1 Tax=Anabaena azotica TaxID=197653 RepID=UPI0039A462D7